jgi:hypothetical protein
MLFFQLLLFAGYCYAHLLKSRFCPAFQAAIHLVLLSLAALMLPIQPGGDWKPSGSETPSIYLLWMLVVHVGLPYFVLSSTGPLIQAWLTYQDDSARVYRLYAVSNAGSLLALLSYPFLVEPMLSVSQQSDVWSLMFLLFVFVQGAVAVRLFRLPSANSAIDQIGRQATDDRSPNWQTPFAWIALSAVASTMLLIITNHVCQDVAVVPFLWVLPLSLYLVSFIICFDSPQWYRPKLTAVVTLAALAVIQLSSNRPNPGELVAVVGCYLLLLFGVCLMCHGEVARLKPPSSLLTHYYACLSAGGALGGILVAVIFPTVFDGFSELRYALILVTALTFLLFCGARGWRTADYDWSRAYRLRYVAAALVAVPLISSLSGPSDRTIASERNFFGVLRVRQLDDAIQLVHGTTSHGVQRRGEHALEPTTYYGRQSGVGIALTELKKQKDSLRIGIVGLGCGVLTTYGREEDRFDIIEINPAVLAIANEHFTFLSRCRSDVRTHLGDGRLVLERMAEQRFDLLVLDAFSSDAIPAHLLTREAMRLFKDRLAEDGVIAVHVSNNHLDLVPLVHRLSHDAGLDSGSILSESDKSRHITRANWVLITDPDHPLWDQPRLASAARPTAEQIAGAPSWTDQHHNLISVLKLW